MSASIQLDCPSCGRRDDYPRIVDPTVPAAVVRIQSACNRCDNGDFSTETWFDADGNEVSQDIR